MKQEPIILRGVVLGRAVARSPLTAQGHPMEASHDEDVSLTLRIPIPGERPLEFSMRVDSLPRGWMEIGDPVTVTVDAAAPKTEPYSVNYERVTTSGEGEPYMADTHLPDAIADGPDVVHSLDCATQPEWLLAKKDPQLAGTCTCGASSSAANPDKMLSER